MLPLAGPYSRWVDQIDRKNEFLPAVTYHHYSKADLTPTGDGRWQLVEHAHIVCERKPHGRVTITLDGEAIRNSLIAWMGCDLSRSIAVGGLVSKPVELEVPAVNSASPPTTGAGITSGP